MKQTPESAGTAVGFGGTEKPDQLDAPGRREFVVYAITNLISQRRYIGLTINARQRWFNHRSALMNNRHWCAEMQADWNSTGSRSFSFTILQSGIASKELGKQAELSHITSAPCYNYMIANSDGDNYTWQPSHRKSQSEKLKRAWQNPDSNLRNPISNRWSKTGAREEHARIMRARYTDPEERRKLAEATKRAQTPEVRLKKSIASKLSWQNPQSKQRLAKRVMSEAGRKSKSENMKAYWASPEGQKIKQLRSEKLRQLWADPTSKLSNRKTRRRDQSGNE